MGGGYLQRIYPEALNALAEKHDVRFYLTQSIGHFAFLNAPLLAADAVGDAPDWDALTEEIKESVILGDVRHYEQDPRFGLIVMGEIGSKAMSPGVNDPGTAIDVITRIERILSEYEDETASEPEQLLAHLSVAPLDPADLLRDGFGALSRDSAGTLEVQMRLQQTLAGLMRHPDEELCKAAREMARNELVRALNVITFDLDQKALILSADPDVRPK